MKQRTETNPIAKYTPDGWVLGEPYEPNDRITCTVYGEMSDGVKVWTDENGKQYTRQRFFGKYYFVEM